MLQERLPGLPADGLSTVEIKASGETFYVISTNGPVLSAVEPQESSRGYLSPKGFKKIEKAATAPRAQSLKQTQAIFQHLGFDYFHTN